MSDVTAKLAVPTHPKLRACYLECVAYNSAVDLSKSYATKGVFRGAWRLSDGREAIIIGEQLRFTRWSADRCDEDGGIVTVEWPGAVLARLAIVLLCGGAEVE